MRLNVVRVPSEQTLAEYLTSGWIENIDPKTVEDVTVNGFPGATAAAKGDQWDFRLYAIRFGSNVYRFIFATKRRSPETDRIFRDSVGAFRRMSLAEIEDAKPLRLQVVTVGPGDTVEKLGDPDGGCGPPDRSLPRAQRARARRAAEVGQRSQDCRRVGRHRPSARPAEAGTHLFLRVRCCDSRFRGNERRSVPGRRRVNCVTGQKLIARLATASAASLTASLNVGWAWQVRAMSSDEAPNSMAIAASAIRVSASGPRMCTPSTRSVLASARILTKPSVARLALGPAVGGERKLADLISDTGLFELFLGLPDRGDFRIGIDDVRDHLVVHVPGLSGNDLRSRNAFVLRLVRERRAGDDIADSVDTGDIGLEMWIDDDATADYPFLRRLPRGRGLR